MFHNKKRLVLGSVVFTLIIISVILGVVSRVYPFINGRVGGSLSSTDIIDVYSIELDHTGKTVFCLSWEPAVETEDTIFKITIENRSKNPVITYEEAFDNSQVTYVDITQSTIGTYTVKVMVKKGAGNYTLNVLKPGETNTSVFTEMNLAYFDVSIPDGGSQEDIQLIWSSVREEMQLATGKIFDKATKSQVYPPAGTVIEPIPANDIHLPELAAGEYTLILKMLTNTPGGAVVTTRNITPVILKQSFMHRHIQRGQVDHFGLQLTGKEKFMWFIWGKATNTQQQHPMPEVKLKNAEGDVIRVGKILDAKDTTVIPLEGLAGGAYSIDVYSALPAQYGLGIESLDAEGMRASTK